MGLTLSTPGLVKHINAPVSAVILIKTLNTPSQCSDSVLNAHSWQRVTWEEQDISFADVVILVVLYYNLWLLIGEDNEHFTKSI